MKKFSYPISTTELYEIEDLLNSIWHGMIENDMEETYVFKELNAFLEMDNE